MSWSKTDQESRLEAVFAGLDADFKRLDKARDPEKAQALLKDVTAKLKDAKALIQEFEREARTDGMPSRELADRKRKLVNQFNTYVNLKKQHSSTEQGRGELLAGAASGQDEAAGGGAATDGMTMQELMKDGRKGVKEIDGTLNRAEKLVEDTLQIGQQTAVTLHDQTQQLNKIVDDLNEIEFTMKKATKIIADIGKGIMTDRCIMFLLFLVVCGVIALVVVKVVKPNKAAIQSATDSITPESVRNWSTNAAATVGSLGNVIINRRRRALLMDQQAAHMIAGTRPPPQQQQEQEPQLDHYTDAKQHHCHYHKQHQSSQHDTHASQRTDQPAAAPLAGGLPHDQKAFGWLQLLASQHHCPRKLGQFCAAAAVRLGMQQALG